MNLTMSFFTNSRGFVNYRIIISNTNVARNGERGTNYHND